MPGKRDAMDKWKSSRKRATHESALRHLTGEVLPPLLDKLASESATK